MAGTPKWRFSVRSMATVNQGIPVTSASPRTLAAGAVATSVPSSAKRATFST